MKILGILLLLAGVLCFAFIVTGFAAWTTPVADGATPASLAGTINIRMLILVGVGTLCVVGGTIAFGWGILMSRAKERGSKAAK